MTTNKWLITGGAGYIGSAIANRMFQKGFQSQVIDDLSNGHRNFLFEDITFYEGDIRDKEILRKSLQGCNGVIHLAANKSVSHSLTLPLENIEENLTPLLSLLTLLREQGINNLIFSSSAAVYGNVPIEKQPIKESAQLCPTNAYGAAKSWCEDAIKLEIASRHFLGLNPLKTVVMRYFNVVGVSGDSQDMSEGGLFSAIRRFYKNNELVKIFGNGFDTKDGTAVRDYISLADLVEAHILLVARWQQLPKFLTTYNLSSNSPSTVLDVISEFEIQTSKKVEIEIQAERIGEIPHSQGDNSEFRNDFSWVPKNSLKTIVGDLLETF